MIKRIYQLAHRGFMFLVVVEIIGFYAFKRVLRAIVLPLKGYTKGSWGEWVEPEAP